MSAFKLNAVFYLNQMYSAISNEDRAKVIDRCYWPLLELIETNIPINVQVSGLSLEIISALDRSWVERLKNCLARNRCQLIGNGYAQIIAPLVPAKLNRLNHSLGHQVYRSILNVKPTIATVNEMAYSSGIIQHFLDSDYSAVYVEWNNPWRYHPEWDSTWRYYRQAAIGADGRTIPILWVDSMASQKFQRYSHGELDVVDYLQFLATHAAMAPDGYLCLYASDTEVFDYRPGRFTTEAEISVEGEWNSIRSLFETVARDEGFEFALASDILAMPRSDSSDNPLRLESPAQPIPVKKQEKYNIYRWALTGRSDLEINTRCHRMFRRLLASNDDSSQDWKRLCYFWSSDFRTHIEEDRWETFRRDLDEATEDTLASHVGAITASDHDRPEQLRVPTGFQVSDDKRYITIKSDQIKCVLDKHKGLAVHSFWFLAKSEDPLFGTLPHGYFDDISFGADFFTGHTIIERPGEHKITDLIPVVPRLLSRDGSTLTLAVTTEQRGVQIAKEYTLVPDGPALEMTIRIDLPCRDVATIHVGNFTVIPHTYDQGSLFFATHNGGDHLETYEIGNDPIHHGESISSLISAKYGLGATGGVVLLGDRSKTLRVFHDQTASALVPSIHYDPMGKERFFFRLQYSAQEMDETFRKDPKPQTIVCKYRVT